jgi:hypothetical protein
LKYPRGAFAESSPRLIFCLIPKAQAGPGEDAAILVSDRVREGDEVYRVP